MWAVWIAVNVSLKQFSMHYWCSEPSPHCCVGISPYPLCTLHGHGIAVSKVAWIFFSLSQRLTCFPCSPTHPFPLCRAAASFIPALTFSNARSLHLVACKQLSSMVLHLIQKNPKSPLFLLCCLILTSLLQIPFLLFPQLAFMLTASCLLLPGFVFGSFLMSNNWTKVEAKQSSIEEWDSESLGYEACFCYIWAVWP